MTDLTAYVSGQIAFGVAIGVVLLFVARMTGARGARSHFPIANRMFSL